MISLRINKKRRFRTVWFFKTYSEKQIKKMSKVLNYIDSLADKYKNMTKSEVTIIID